MCTGVRGRRFGGLVYGQSGPRDLLSRAASREVQRSDGGRDKGHREGAVLSYLLIRSHARSSNHRSSLAPSHSLISYIAPQRRNLQPAGPRGARREADQRGWSSRGEARRTQEGITPPRYARASPQPRGLSEPPHVSRGPPQKKTRGSGLSTPQGGTHQGKRTLRLTSEKKLLFCTNSLLLPQKEFL